MDTWPEGELDEGEPIFYDSLEEYKMNSEDLKTAPKWFQKWYSNDFKHMENRISWLNIQLKFILAFLGLILGLLTFLGIAFIVGQ